MWAVFKKDDHPIIANGWRFVGFIESEELAKELEESLEEKGVPFKVVELED